MTDKELATTPMEMIAAAVEKGLGPEVISQFMDLQERWQANLARSAYAADMNKVQARALKVRRNQTNKQTGSMYADLEAIHDAMIPISTEHGFSLCFGTEESPKSSTTSPRYGG